MDREELITELQKAIRKSQHHRHRYGNKEDSKRGIVLKYLYDQGGSASPGRICTLLHVTTARVTVLLNELEEEHLIIREVAPHDRRRVCVELTEKGRQSVEQWNRRGREETERLVEKIGEEDAKALLRICHAMEEIRNEDSVK
ncbi:MAG: MarR family winged helix-turn-helix transcriptional regulator [Lachnospiraceae bacterium]|nr:MarR family winged helix-turn-helix transcriptional regulator [Lachnospiraceae bacterium]